MSSAAGTGGRAGCARAGTESTNSANPRISWYKRMLHHSTRLSEERMPLEQQLNDTLKQAIKDKDQDTADVVRMIKTKIMERRTAKGFSGEVDDALVVDTIGAYRKQLQKAVVEFEKAGDRGAQQAARLRAEIVFCERY